MAVTPTDATGNEPAATADLKSDAPASPSAEPRTEGLEDAPAVDAPSDVDGAKADEEDEEDEEEEKPSTEAAQPAEVMKWPGWPGYNVFRLIVPLAKVGSIIGRKGELIKKLCDETRASVRVLDGPISNLDRIVLITGKEEPEAQMSPAIDALLRVFKRVNEIADSGEEGSHQIPIECSTQLLVPLSQGVNLIGKKGELIKSIQESSGATVRVLSGGDPNSYVAADERIVDIRGEFLKVLKALEAVAGHLRKFLVDQTVLPMFKKNYNAPVTAVSQDTLDVWGERAPSVGHAVQQSVVTNDYGPPLKRESLFLDRESQIDPHIQRNEVALYRQEPGLSGIRSGFGRSGGALATQVTQIMHIPLAYAEDIIGIRGANIAYIRETSGAVLTIEETRGFPDEITIEIKGTSSQVHVARQLIQDFISERREPVASRYEVLDSSVRSTYSQLPGAAYPSSSYSTRYGSYDYSRSGGYRGF